MDVKIQEDEDKGNLRYIVSTPKANSDFVVQKSNDGFALFDVHVTGGKVPKELSGKYTSAEKGLKAVEAYIKKMKETAAVRRDNMTKRREASKNAKAVQSDNKKHVQQGTAN